MKPKKILIADSDEEFCRSLTVLLKAQGYQVATAADAVSAISTAVKVQPDLVILDSALPGGGVQTAERMRLLADLDLVPMILLGPGGRSPVIDQSVVSAAEIFLSKPVDPDFLVRCVGKELSAAETLQAAKPPGETQLFNEMTGLCNREAFILLTEHHMRISNRTKKGFALMLLKVSNLEEIREAQGAFEAEHAIVRTAQTLKESFRSSDIIAHICGGEFAVLALETKSVGQDLLTRRLYENLKHLNSEAARRCRVTLKAGVVRYDPVHPMSLAELVKDFDTSLVGEVQA